MMQRFLPALLAVGLIAPVQAQVELRLKETASAESRRVRLADIATVRSTAEGVRTEALENTVVAFIAHLDQPLRIDAAQLERIITRQQPGLIGKLQLTGAEAVSVTVPGQELPGARIAESARDFLHAELAQRVKRFEIREVRVTRESIAVPKGRVALQPRFAGAWKPAGRMHVMVDVLINGQRIDSVPVTAETELALAAYRLTRPVTAGESLAPADFEIAEVMADRARPASLIDTGAVIAGLRARRSLAAGTALHREDVESVPHVGRNQKVLAEWKSNGIVIEKTVTAQADGRLGQVIRVTDTQSAASWSATVVAQGRVEVK